MDSLITTFHIDWKIIVAQAINFGIVFLVLYFFALKPLKKLMAERSDRIARGLDDAKTNAELVTKTQKEYENVLSKARVEANEIFQAGKKEAEENKAVMMAKAQTEVENMIASGKKALEAEKIKMVDEAKNEIVSLVVRATEKLLEGEADASFDQKSVSQLKKI
jgi:F-type H+-transporting ATPase subunit b